MRTIKCLLVLTDNEYSLIINSLNNLRNDLIAQGRYTDAVDEKINQILSITPHLRKEIDKLDEFIIDMKNKYLRPDKDE